LRSNRNVVLGDVGVLPKGNNFHFEKGGFAGCSK
jgi:hypothetical protein